MAETEYRVRGKGYLSGARDLESLVAILMLPLALTKTFSMAGAAILSITWGSVLMLLFIRGRILPEARNPVNRALIWATGRSLPACCAGRR